LALKNVPKRLITNRKNVTWLAREMPVATVESTAGRASLASNVNTQISSGIPEKPSSVAVQPAMGKFGAQPALPQGVRPAEPGDFGGKRPDGNPK
jgi:hypothetical protein